MNYSLINEVMKKYGINNVYFEGMNEDMIKEIISGLDLVYSKYPLVFEKINAIGREEYIRVQILNDYGPRAVKEYKKKTNENNPMSCLSINKSNGLEGVYISIRDNIFDRKPKNDESKSIRDLFTIKSMIIHELGHALDYLLDLRNDPILKEELIKIDYNTEEIYKTGEINEAIAVLFQYYMNGYSNILSDALVRRIDEKYSEYKIRYENDKSMI